MSVAWEVGLQQRRRRHVMQAVVGQHLKEELRRHEARVDVPVVRLHNLAAQRSHNGLAPLLGHSHIQRHNVWPEVAVALRLLVVELTVKGTPGAPLYGVCLVITLAVAHHLCRSGQVLGTEPEVEGVDNLVLRHPIRRHPVAEVEEERQLARLRAIHLLEHCAVWRQPCLHIA